MKKRNPTRQPTRSAASIEPLTQDRLDEVSGGWGWLLGPVIGGAGAHFATGGFGSIPGDDYEEVLGWGPMDWT